MLDLNKCVRFAEDHSVDIKETLKACELEIEKHNVAYSSDMMVIEAAVGAVFDRFPGATIATSALIGFVLNDLGANPNTYKLLRSRVEDHLNSKKDILYSIRVGKGVSRIVSTTT